MNFSDVDLRVAVAALRAGASTHPPTPSHPASHTLGHVTLAPTRHYLDHAATTPLRHVAAQAWAAAAKVTGNASSVHTEGRAARALVEDARERLAAAVGAHPTEVIFTGGATEACNLAVTGTITAALAAGRAPMVAVSAVEHPAVREPALAARGATVTELPVDARGVVDMPHIEALTGPGGPDVTLLAVQAVNNEVGTIQPLAQVVAAAAARGIPVHADAVQALGHLPLHFGSSGLTSMALSAHKVGGPPGVGALLLRRDAVVHPVLHGGGQERAVRSGTLNVPGIVGFAAAVEEALATQGQTAVRLTDLRDTLAAGIRAALPEATVRGDDALGAPHIVHAVIPGASSEAMLFMLDSHGIAASSGSACTAGVVQPSHVVRALGHDAVQAGQVLRLSLGHTSTRADVDALLTHLTEVVRRAREATSPAPTHRP